LNFDGFVHLQAVVYVCNLGLYSIAFPLFPNRLGLKIQLMHIDKIIYAFFTLHLNVKNAFGLSHPQHLF